MLVKIFFLLSYLVIVVAIYYAVTARNPVYAVLALILAFIGVASLLILLSADYLAILFILIYAGAISILIMFVVMMLDLKEMELSQPPVARTVTTFFVAFILGAFSYLLTFLPTSTRPRLYYTDWLRVFNTHSNIETVGEVLFSLYNFQFLLLGLLLYLAMVIVISLVIRKGTFARRQDVSKQVKHTNKNLLKIK